VPLVMNGVIFGNVPDHRKRKKRTGEGQTWFPASWTEHDIMAAGIRAANRGTMAGKRAKEAVHKGVKVKIFSPGGRIGTICPSYDQP